MERASENTGHPKQGEIPKPPSTDPAVSLETPQAFARHNSQDRIHLALIVGVALLLRLSYLYLSLRNNPAFHFPIMDSLYHHEWAREIVSGNFWGDEVFFRGPLYPYFLALLFKLSGSSITFAVLCQHLIGSLTCGLVYLLAREYYSRGVSLLSGLLAATYWTSIYFEGELLIVTCALFLNTLCLVLLARSIKRDDLRLLLAAGIVLGLSTIARPSVLVFLPAIPIAFYLTRRSSASNDKRFATSWIGRSIVVFTACFLVILPVMIRNYVVARAIVPIASSGGVNFYIGNNPSADGRTAIVPGTDAPWWGGNEEAIAIAERAVGRKLSPAEASNYYLRRGFEFIASEPARAALLLLKKLDLFWSGPEQSNEKFIYFFWHLAGVGNIPLPGFWLVAHLALLGIILQLRRSRELSVLYLFVLSYMLGVIAFFVNARFRLPVLPVLIIFAAFAIRYLISAYRLSKSRLIKASLVLLIAAFLVNWHYPAFHRNRGKHLAISHYTVASAYLQMNRRNEAIAEYIVARQKYAQHPTPSYELIAREIDYKLGALYWENGECANAIEVLKNVQGNDEKSVAVRCLLADCYLRMKQVQRAIAVFEEALRIMPGYAPALTGLAEAYEAIGNLERAESILQSVTNRSSGVDVSTYMALARVQRKLGKFDAAAQSYSKISQFPGHERDAILGLADLFREKGDKERALQLLEQARPYFPENDPSLEEMIRSIRNGRQKE